MFDLHGLDITRGKFAILEILELSGIGISAMLHILDLNVIMLVKLYALGLFLSSLQYLKIWSFVESGFQLCCIFLT